MAKYLNEIGFEYLVEKLLDIVGEQMADITKLTAEVVSSLPGTPETNVSGVWASLGDTSIDLSGYWAKTDLVALTN